MGYLVLIPLIVGTLLVLVVVTRQGTRPTTRSDLVKVGIVAGGFAVLAILAGLHLAMNQIS